MADSIRLDNSSRSLNKVTYTPLVLPAATEGNALQMAAAAAELRLVPGEAQNARRQTGISPAADAALAQFGNQVEAETVAKRLGAAGRLAATPTAALTEAIEAIRTIRTRDLDDCLGQVAGLVHNYRAATERQERSGGGEAGTPGVTGRMAMMERRLAALLNVQAGESAAEEGAFAGLERLRPEMTALARVAGSETPAKQAPQPLPAPVAVRLGPEIAPFAAQAMEWSRANAPDSLKRLLETAGPVVPAALRQAGPDFLFQGLTFLIEQTQLPAVVIGHLTQRNLQPVGLLHLEKLVITPLQVERGELLYSLPLSPGEKVTLAHKEWTLREEEYTRFVQDYFENYSERGVAEKNDMAMATRTENEHSKTLSMTKPVAPGSATVADPVQAVSTSEDVTKEKESQEKSRRETRETTDKASTLAIRNQKVSFTVTTVSGVEDFTARLYENKRENETMMIEYFRRMRRWHNQLYRTGIRLTYDVVLPDPGRILRDRWMEVEEIDRQLAAPFEFSIPDWAWRNQGSSPFSIYLAQDPSVAYFEELAQTYGVALTEKPGAVTAVEETHAINEGPVGASGAFTVNVTLEIPDGYQPTKVSFGGRAASAEPALERSMLGHYWSQKVPIPADGIWHGRDLTLPLLTPKRFEIGFIAYNGAVGQVRVRAEVEPTDEAWLKWRTTSASILRQGAFARYTEARETLRQRRAALLEDLEAPDALALRRMEREQILYLVLRWLFPDFDQSGKAYKDAAAQKPGSWQPAMEYGEYIKFVHQAIDWDNALILLYPYFWDNPDQHPAKLYLNHADGAHKEFLRAGAARVILAIQPGYEEEVVGLLDKGQIGQHVASTRFRPIIERVQAAHKKFAALFNQEFTTQPQDDDEGEEGQQPKHGELIGEWFDWTPTSALDMTTTVKPVDVLP